MVHQDSSSIDPPSGSSQPPRQPHTTVHVCVCDCACIWYTWYYLMKWYRVHISPERIVEKMQTTHQHPGRSGQGARPHHHRSFHFWRSWKARREGAARPAGLIEPHMRQQQEASDVCNIYAIQCAASNTNAVALWQLFARSTLRTWKPLVSSSLMLWLLVRHKLDIFEPTMGAI